MTTLAQERLSDYVSKLRALLLQQLSGEKKERELAAFGELCLWKEFELAHVLYALNCHQVGIFIEPPDFEQTPSGAALLFARGGFSWGSLPYPVWHAEFAALCALLAKWTENKSLSQRAKKMTQWQLNTLDHRGLPIYSLFLQEEGTPFKELVAANFLAFSVLGDEFAPYAVNLLPYLDTNLPQVQLVKALDAESDPKKDLALKLETDFIDREVGLALVRKEQSTILALTTGCKSSLGAFLHGDIGILGYGPQTPPLGECHNFGLVGRPFASQFGEAPEFSLSTKTALAMASSRETGWASLQDSDYSGCFIETTQIYDHKSLKIHARMLPAIRCPEVVFVFFGVAKSCFVGAVQKLNPCTFDRYAGPPDEIFLKGDEHEMVIRPVEGAIHLEVIPLAEGDAFWGANFLIAFSSSNVLSSKWEIEALQKNEFCSNVRERIRDEFT